MLGDRVQVQQVLLNLVRNSMEAMRAVVDRPRELRQTQRQALGGVLVSVKDSGIGLRAEEGVKLFEPFFPPSRVAWAWGCRISRAIVEAHGGQLWAIPNDEHGATFLFTLPTGAEMGMSGQTPSCVWWMMIPPSGTPSRACSGPSAGRGDLRVRPVVYKTDNVNLVSIEINGECFTFERNVISPVTAGTGTTSEQPYHASSTCKVIAH